MPLSASRTVRKLGLGSTNINQMEGTRIQQESYVCSNLHDKGEPTVLDQTGW